MSKYTIGLGYGGGCGRAVLIDTEDGRVVASAVKEYSRGILNNHFEHPMDYLEVVTDTIPKLLAASAVSGEDIIGIGVSFPAGTILPVLKDGTPLCFFNEFKDKPEAYARVSAYGTCTDEFKKFNDLATERSEAFLSRYGGKAGSSRMIPAILKTVEDAPEVYDTCDYFIEAADWISWQLTGRQTRSSSLAGFYGTWSKKEGYPSKDFLSALSPKLKDLGSTKLDCPISVPGTRCGFVSTFVARNTGLSTNTAVAVGTEALQACMAATGIAGTGTALAEIDRTTKFILLSDEEKFVPGISAMAEDGIYPGFVGYRADNAEASAYLNRFKKNFADAEYITERALQQAPGKNAMVAADGALVGITLKTTQESIMKALIESTVFSVKRTLAEFKKQGIAVESLYVTGDPDIADADLAGLYADILEIPVSLASDKNLTARGAAIFAALAAGGEAGGYASVTEAVKHMGRAPYETLLPEDEAAEIYNKLFDEQTRLLDYFNGGANDCLKRLKNLGPEDSDDDGSDEDTLIFEEEFEEVPTLASEFGITDEDDITADAEVPAEETDVAEETEAAEGTDVTEEAEAAEGTDVAEEAEVDAEAGSDEETEEIEANEEAEAGDETDDTSEDESEAESGTEVESTNADAVESLDTDETTEEDDKADITESDDEADDIYSADYTKAIVTSDADEFEKDTDELRNIEEPETAAPLSMGIGFGIGFDDDYLDFDFDNKPAEKRIDSGAPKLDTPSVSEDESAENFSDDEKSADELPDEGASAEAYSDEKVSDGVFPEEDESEESTPGTDIYSFSEDDVTDEIRANAEKSAEEIFRIVDEVVQVINDAELHAVFDDLIREEADRETEELLSAIDEVVKTDEEAAHMAVFGDLIEEEAEKNTQEILNAVDDVIGVINDAELDAANNWDDLDDLMEEPIIITAADLEAKKFSDYE